MSNVVTASTGRSFTSQTIKYANSSLKSTSDSTVTPYLTAGNQWAYIAVVLGILVFAALLALAVLYLWKRSKRSKLRQHLMPLYTFDPAEEAGDWDCDLLEADRDQQMVLRRLSSPFRSTSKSKLDGDFMDT